MIRSLFIGFLILSALTSKGAGIQIVSNLNIVPGSLPDIISAAASACAGKTSGLSAASGCSVLPSSADRSIKGGQSFCQNNNSFAPKKDLLIYDDESCDPPVQTGSDAGCNELPQCGASNQDTAAGLCGGEPSRTSGLSPPY